MAERPQWEPVTAAIKQWLGRGMCATPSAFPPESKTTVRWAHEAGAADSTQGQEFWGELQIRSFLPVGIDYVRRTYNASANRLDVVVCGHRELTVTVRVHSRCQGAAQNPHVYLERARTALRWPSSLLRFRTAFLGLSQSERSLEVPTKISGRDTPAAQMDVRFFTVASLPDSSVTYIERVAGSGTLTAGGETFNSAYDSNGGP